MITVPAFHILVISEDSGKQSGPTIQALVRKALKIVDPDIDLGPNWVRFEPLLEGQPGWLAAAANRWKTVPRTRDTILLIGRLASHIALPGGFVVFHYDSDRTWSRARTSENRQKFKEYIRDEVTRTLKMGGVGQGGMPPMTEEEAAKRAARIFEFSPCYSVESWLYQNTKFLEGCCETCQEGNPDFRQGHVAMIQSWAADRTLLDEVSKPKHDVLPCVGDRSNEELSKGFPGQVVYDARRSWAEGVDAMRSNQDLAKFARDTHPDAT